MADSNKQYIRILPQIRVPMEGQIVSADYNEAYKFYTCFLMTGQGLVQFKSTKPYKVGQSAKVLLGSTQYNFNELV